MEGNAKDELLGLLSYSAQGKIVKEQYRHEGRNNLPLVSETFSCGRDFSESYSVPKVKGLAANVSLRKHPSEASTQPL